MKFLISKELVQGKYIVRVDLKEFSGVDAVKANKFGMPMLRILLPNGREAPIPINTLNQYAPFDFKTQADADNYALRLKDEINKLRESWETLEDKWSKQEEI